MLVCAFSPIFAFGNKKQGSYEKVSNSRYVGPASAQQL